jgi:hypothetical protein
MCRKIRAKVKLQRNNFEAIKSFQSGKTPGLDGIPAEVYQVFFDILKAPLLGCFNYSYRNGSLSGIQQEGLISLLLKQDPDGKYKDLFFNVVMQKY